MIEDKDSRVPEILLRYLERTAEFLSTRAKNSRDSALFIPVPIHREVAVKLTALSDSCQALLKRARVLIPSSTKKSKSWFSLYVHYANILPNILTVGYGLGGGNLDKDIPSERLNELFTELSSFENDQDLLTTKTTSGMLGITDFAGEPRPTGDYHEHVPSIKPIIESFKQYMTRHEEYSKDGVLEAIKTDYPKPLM
ncbi:MAG: hypothetical protein AB7I18_10605 [Candidatus Berkiella sp.]